MKTIILHILCEGQTEERFVYHVLNNYLSQYSIICKPQILITNKQKKLHGGMLSYEQVKRDLRLMFKQYQNNDYSLHYFTTMFDLYKLPTDFPQINKHFGDKYCYVNNVEDAFAKDIDHKAFIPYIQLHEFEALVFAGLSYLENEYQTNTKLKRRFRNLHEELKKKNNNPELINTNKAPSKYIIEALEGMHHYDKPKIGVSVTSKVTIPILKTQCSHFAQWINKLEQLNNSSNER